MAKHRGRRASPDQRISDGVGAFNKELEEAKDGISMIDMNIRNMSAIANGDFKAVPHRPSTKKLMEMLKSFQSKLKDYDLDMESAVKMHLSARKGSRHLTAMQMTPQKKRGGHRRKKPAEVLDETPPGKRDYCPDCGENLDYFKKGKKITAACSTCGYKG